MKRWSCSDLHYSLYLAPDRVRTCCQRFFVNDVIKGDVELFTIDNSVITGTDLIDQTLLTKQKLFNDINLGKETDCSGCPFLSYENWPAITNLKIKHLSLEYHSICNLKCNYCSDTYYGGMRPKYDVKNVLSELYNNNSLEECKSVVWGGGEPLADNGFEGIFQFLTKNIHANYKIFTNSIKYSKPLNDLISKDLVTITTSIDAGSSRVFEQVRGRDKLNFVIENLKKYSFKKPRNVVIKYVFTNENYSLSEVNLFIKLIKENNLNKCYFQISFDYYLEEVSEEQLLSVIVMYGLIKNELKANVFLDDLLWHRINKSFIIYKSSILQKLKLLEFSNFLADYNNIVSVVIWGAGKIASDMMENSDFLQHVEIDFIVDSNAGEIQSFNGIDVYSPEYLLNNKSMIIIAASQGYSSILRDFYRIGISKDRIIHGLII
jgi:pyruvate-formate lyase-activating enzyme